MTLRRAYRPKGKDNDDYTKSSPNLIPSQPPSARIGLPHPASADLLLGASGPTDQGFHLRLHRDPHCHQSHRYCRWGCQVDCEASWWLAHHSPRGRACVMKDLQHVSWRRSFPWHSRPLYTSVLCHVVPAIASNS